MIARAEGRIVASVAYRPYDGRFPQLNYQGRKTVEVVRLYVLPAVRRLGLAGRLYRSLEALARADGIEVMYTCTPIRFCPVRLISGSGRGSRWWMSRPTRYGKPPICTDFCRSELAREKRQR